MVEVNPKWFVLPLAVLLVVAGYSLEQAGQLKTGGPAQTAGTNVPISLTLVGGHDSLQYANRDIRPLSNGLVIDMATLGSSLNIVARTNSPAVKSISFAMPWLGLIHYENVLPYAAASNHPTPPYNYNTLGLPAGTHTLTVTAYSMPVYVGQGHPSTILGSTSVTFTVLGGNMEPLVVPVEMEEEDEEESGDEAVFQRPADLATANIVAFATHFAPNADLARVVRLLNQQPSVINTLYIERPHPGEAAWTEVTSQREAPWQALLVPQANHLRVWSVHRPTAAYYQPVEESVWYDQSFWNNLLARVRQDTQALPSYYQNRPWTGLDLEMYGDNDQFANRLDLIRLGQAVEPLRGAFDVCLPYWPGENIQAEAALLSDVLCARHVYPGYYDWPWRIDPIPPNGIIQLLVTLDGRLFEGVEGQVTYTPARVVELARTRGNIMIWPIDDPVEVAQAIINASR